MKSGGEDAGDISRSGISAVDIGSLPPRAPMTLKDRVCVVAGASGSIGREICNHLWAEGADVIALGRSKPRMIDAKLQGHAELFEADLTIASDLDRLVARLNRKRSLDVLVLSSGIYERFTDATTFRTQLEANLVGPYAAI